MDNRLRQLERLAYEEPEAYYHAIKRSGELKRLKAADEVLWLQTLQKCNRLGPLNLEVLGMLGYAPAVTIMGGAEQPRDCYYWWRGRWYTEEAVHHRPMNFDFWRGRDYHSYTKCLHRLSFRIRRIEWMKKIAFKLSRRMALGEWLYELENRTILQHQIVDGLH